MIVKCDRCHEIIILSSMFGDNDIMGMNCSCGGIYYKYSLEALVFNIYNILLEKKKKKRFWRK